MIRFFLRIVVFLGTAALGLLAAKLLVSGFTLSPRGFITTVVVFAILQAVLSPLVAKLAQRYASAISGGVGIITTLLALVITNFTGGLTIVGVSAWAFSALLVWLVTAIGGAILESIFLKKPVEE